MIVISSGRLRKMQSKFMVFIASKVTQANRSKMLSNKQGQKQGNGFTNRLSRTTLESGIKKIENW